MKKLEEIKLSEYAKRQGEPYKKIWNLANAGALPVEIKKSPSGRISVMIESKASVPQNVILATPLMSNKEGNTYNFNISTASSPTRRNKAATSRPTDEYSQISMGVSPFEGKNGSSISISEAIKLCQLCYYNFSIFRSTIDLMTEFSTNKIFFRGGTAKSRKFFENLFDSLNILDLQDKFFREYYRSSNVFIYKFKVSLKKEDIKQLITAFQIEAKNKIELPSKYIILNPADISCKGALNFTESTFTKILNGYELARLRLPADKQTKQEKNFLKSLDEEIQKQIKNGVNVEIPLKPENTYAIFFKKQDYESLAVPMAYPVLKDINAKAEQKSIDMAVSRTMTQVILLIKMGYESKDGEYMFDPNAANAMRELFASDSVGKVLVSDFSTDAKWVIPDLASFLAPAKYEIINQDIKEGLNSLLTGGESKFANQFIQTQIFIQRLRQARESFLTHFLIPEIKKISDEMNFKSYPKPIFTESDLTSPDEFNRIITRLAEIGVLTPSEVFDGIENSRLPTAEESEEAQEKFKLLKEKGYYAPIAGGGNQIQLDTLKLTQKNQEKMLDKTQEHDDKQKTKDRKHAAENPEQPAPQIHINSPNIKQQSGKPKGKTGKQSTTRKTSPMKASLEDDNSDDNLYEEKYSLSKFKDNMILIGELNSNIKNELLKKYKLKELNKEQNEILQGISEVIISDQDSSNWNNKEIILSYVNEPIAKNESRLNEINEIAANHSISLYLAGILLNSKKDN